VAAAEPAAVRAPRCTAPAPPAPSPPPLGDLLASDRGLRPRRSADPRTRGGRTVSAGAPAPATQAAPRAARCQRSP